jgi:hypothetical protein
MFEETPSLPTPPSQRTTIAGFGVFFAFFVITSATAWFRWSGPVSLNRKITVAQFIVVGVLSGVFLLTAKSSLPESNRKRMIGLLLASLLFSSSRMFSIGTKHRGHAHCHRLVRSPDLDSYPPLVDHCRCAARKGAGEFSSGVSTACLLRRKRTFWFR